MKIQIFKLHSLKRSAIPGLANQHIKIRDLLVFHVSNFDVQISESEICGPIQQAGHRVRAFMQHVYIMAQNKILFNAAGCPPLYEVWCSG